MIGSSVQFILSSVNESSKPFFARATRALATLAILISAPTHTFGISLDEFNGTQSVVSNPTNLTNFGAGLNAGIVGGARKLRVSWLAGANSPAIDADASVVDQNSEGTFIYSQDATVAAQCLISWDGTTLPSPAASLFPNGLDLLQDGGNAFTLEVIGSDLPSDLEVVVTDATDINKTSRTTVNLPAGGARTISIPFAALTGNADLRTVGALSLLINKSASQALDLSLAYFGTNGQCRIIPNGAGRVIDECGVCGGDNSSCADCAGVPHGSAVLDQCGVCGGNGTSCLDCTGVPNGPARLDRCNVCNGNGTSCLGCTQNDITVLLATMDASAKSQEALLKNIYRQIERSTTRRTVRKNVAAYRAQAHALQIRNWTLSWTVPRVTTTCANTTFCTTVSNRAYIEEYRKNSLSLKQMTVDALKLWQKVNRNARKHTTAYLRTATRLHKQNEAYLATVPATQSACS